MTIHNLLGFLIPLAVLGLIAMLTYLYYRNRVLKLMKKLDHIAGHIPPLRMKLKEIHKDKSHKYCAAEKKIIAELESLSFQKLGLFKIEETAHSRLHAFSSPDESTYAVLIKCPQEKSRLKFYCTDDKGKIFIAHSADDPGLDHPDFTQFTYFNYQLDQTEPVAAPMWESVQQVSHRQKLAPIAFKKNFNRLYQREMNWRINRHGLSRKEVLHLAECSGYAVPTNEEIELIQEHWHIAISETIREDVRNSYRQRHGEEIWEKTAKGFFVIHNQRNKALLLEGLGIRLSKAGFKGKERNEFLQSLEEKFKTSSIMDVCAEELDKLSEQFEIKRLENIDKPWPALCYYIPKKSL